MHWILGDCQFQEDSVDNERQVRNFLKASLDFRKWAVTTMATMGRTRLGMPAPSFIHYIVTLYALDIGRLPVSGRLSGQNVFQAMDERIQDTGEKLANYSLNPAMT